MSSFSLYFSPLVCGTLKANFMKHLLTLILSVMLVQFTQAQTKKLTPEEIIQLQTDRYNARDLDGFMSFFSPGVKVYNLRTGEITFNNFEECYKAYKEVFDLSPNLHSSTVKRMVYENVVIEHERIEGRKGSKVSIEFVVISEIEGEKIKKVTFIRPQ
jgi:hypothetical protein